MVVAHDRRPLRSDAALGLRVVGAVVSAALRLDAVSVSYRGRPAVQQITGEFERGSLTAIVGPNGAGKSTLMHALAGQAQEMTGAVRLAPDLHRRVAYLPQRSRLDPSFPMRVGDVVMLGHWGRLGSFRAAGAAHHARAVQALADVGLDGFGARLAEELSAGQLQRVLFARALLQDAPLILLDEPFNAIDARTTADLMALIARWHEEGRTVIAVLHDLDQVRRHFPQTLLMARELVAWGPTAQALQPANLARARQMSERWDDRIDVPDAFRTTAAALGALP
jgi:zinc/manganese transport system ATP-binding protein